MAEPSPILEAEFDPRVCTYWMLQGLIALVVSVVGIPLIPFLLLFGFPVCRRYMNHLHCSLTDKTLVVKKGLLTRIEKTVPLEKITDLGMIQGPIMRMMNLHRLSIETAGSSGGAGGALVALVGIRDAPEFRNRVLAQRDLVQESSSSVEPSPAAGVGGQQALLEEIRDTLLRIEQQGSPKG